MTLNSIKRAPIRIFRELNAHIHDGSSHRRIKSVKTMHTNGESLFGLFNHLTIAFFFQDFLQTSHFSDLDLNMFT